VIPEFFGIHKYTLQADQEVLQGLVLLEGPVLQTVQAVLEGLEVLVDLVDSHMAHY
jgi:hypothetical protein